MTVFSYAAGRLANKQFTEPIILNDLARRIGIIKEKSYKRHPLGWMIHLGVGIIFLVGYDLLWRTSLLSPTVFIGSVLGFISGVIGVIGWHLTLKIHPDPPGIHLKDFYFQLVIAHIIFGIVAAVSYELMSRFP